MDQSNTAVRINKYISERGFCSRREADKLIEEKRVTINGQLAEMGSKVGPKDFVKVDNKPLKEQAAFVYIALNKPVGIVSTSDTQEKNNIVSFVNYSKRIFPVGRLDKDSEGLILLTNDGDIVNKILRAGNSHEKEYTVVVDHPITDSFIEGMSAGVPILGIMTKPCTVRAIGPKSFKILLTEGLNRQIRRMCEYFGYDVVKLKRTRIMNILLKDLPVGKWRHLTSDELKALLVSVESSIKTEEASHSPKARPLRSSKPKSMRSHAKHRPRSHKQT